MTGGVPWIEGGANRDDCLTVGNLAGGGHHGGAPKRMADQ